MAAATTTAAAGYKTQTAAKPAGWFNHSALLIKDPARSVPFYQERFGFTLVHKQAGTGTDSYFLATLEDDVIAALPADNVGTEAAAFVKAHTGTFLQLVHEHGSESDDGFAANNGNVEPHRGFGHIAVAVPDVYAACEQLEKAGVAFQKKPDEGRMRGLAFALDPDGYWIEVIRRSVPNLPGLGLRPSFAQTMLRVTDPAEALRYFQVNLGMTLLDDRHFGAGRGDFSLFFLASLPEGTELPAVGEAEAHAWMTGRNLCVVELTHNHGTEKDAAHKYHNGYDAPRGFCHVGFACDDAAAVSGALGSAGSSEVLLPRDGYKIQLLPRA